MKRTSVKEQRAMRSLLYTDIRQERRLDSECKCPYCGGKMIIRPADFLNTKYEQSEYMVCMNYPACDSYCRVGKVNGKYEMVSTPANRQLRTLRSEAHFWVDKLVEVGIYSNLSAAFYALSQRTSISNGRRIHIGQCREYVCRQIISECVKILYSNRDKFERFSGWYSSNVNDESIYRMMRAISFKPERV